MSMNHSLQRLFDLIKKTGDRLIIYDSNDDQAFAIMSLEAYEQLLGEPVDWDDERDIPPPAPDIVMPESFDSPQQSEESGVKTEVVNLGQVEPDNNDKYFFEEVDEE